MVPSSRSHRPGNRGTRAKRRPFELERLEGRDVPTATLMPNGTLLVEGRDDPSFGDWIVVERSGSDLIVSEDSNPQAFPVSQVAAIDIRGRRGSDRIEIDSIRALIPVTIDGGDGEDRIGICPWTRDLSNILGSPIAVQGGAGGDSLDIDDRNNQSNATYTITGTSVTRLFVGQITYAGVTDLELEPSGANSTVNVRGTAAGTEWEVDNSGGTDTVNVGSPTAGLDTILGPVNTFFTDLVRLNNSGGTHTLFTFPDWDTVNWAGANRVNLIGGRIEFNGGAGAERFVVDPFLQPSDLTVNGGGGSDTLEAGSLGLPVLGNHWRVTGGAAGVLNGRVTFSAVERLDDTGGGAVLDYSAYTSSIFVNLAAHTATGFSSVAGMTVVIGGSNADILAASAGGSVLLGGGGDDWLIGAGGWDLLIGGAGADSLDGRGGDDILIGGTTAYDADREALIDVWFEWAGWGFQTPYTNRVANLRSGTADGHKLDSTTVFLNDGAKNTLTGGAGLDWFWCDAGQQTLAPDVMTDRTASEILR